ncbi:hypothetical protein LLH06_18395 [Mucilaginibacter daejeonensis]|uniref:hypothetical protein n=1 Tax=Mucilaginibacter daejeonensis TaxID=398049 RepID=UPI001D1728A0|nr:hypothetical protein [Mucilaginibacter daejeonensis]UEG55403.1 hypothetical protein LLH06_18395 [Mucilaginibacter daejeonensis]
MNMHNAITKQIGITREAKAPELPELSFFTGAVGFDGAVAITLNLVFSFCL